VFSLDKEDDNCEIHPHSISKKDFGGKAIDLLLYEKHFILIECLDRCIIFGNGHTMFNCNRCQHGFKSKENRDSHMQCCGLFKPCKTTMSSEDNTKIKLSGTKCLTIPVLFTPTLRQSTNLLMMKDYERPNIRWYQAYLMQNVIKVKVLNGLMLEIEMLSRNSSMSCIAFTQN